ncbi:alpha/beta hydrolase [Paenibacillus sp. TRM 82003]|nr:alpha/beta hydrolase [Paenibacillus sp. TRM 82003]
MTTKAKTVLLLHGFPLNPDMWSRQVNALEAEGYQVITPDLRIDGEAGEDGLPEPVTMEHMADAAIEALDAAEVERCVVVGFSMGGYVAFSLLEKAPERVSGLVLTDTRAEGDSEEGKAGRRTLAANVIERGAQVAADAMLGKLFSPKTPEREPELVREVERMILAATPQAIASSALGMALRPDRTASLAAIAVPTLVVVGEDDAITPPDVARKMADAIPNAELAVVPEAGHLANMERADIFNRTLVDWLARR